MIRLLTVWTRNAVVAVSMAVSIPAITFAQTTESAIKSVPAESKTEEVNASPMGDDNGTGDDAFVETAPFARSEIPVDINVGSQSRFNDLRRELLDDRAKLVDWWLAALAVILGFFAIVAVVGGYIAFARFREIEAEAKNSIVAAKQHEAAIENIRSRIEILLSESEERVQHIKSLDTFEYEVAAENPAEANQAVEDAREDPGASLTGKAIANAISLQQQGKRDDAIEKWRAIAHVVEGSDNDLSAQAWFSVGYLLYQDKDLENSLGAYDRAIHLKPDFAEAFNNRGNAKADSGQYAAAIADYDEAIHLKPGFATAFNNRGASKAVLKQYGDAIADCDTAIRLKPDLVTAFNNRGNAKADSGQYALGITDFDEAIHLKPDYAGAYINRGIAKVKLNLKDEARKDFEIALTLPRNAEDTGLQTKAEKWLRDLDAAEGS